MRDYRFIESSLLLIALHMIKYAFAKDTNESYRLCIINMRGGWLVCRGGSWGCTAR
ncbi:Hypothetical protein BN2458_PEG1891 [Helicobacter typhlonius]|uniref:Uncharacterized protein n=1 Tax=Helicobacter typhlonius TaxID=76936 RepID=A0A0S4PYD4_9HELI|nr:Hypothetical protein BN2458_PEG1891 [Helicobacter typhlonius]